MANDTKLLSILQVVAAHPAFTAGSLRWMVFHAQDNGMAQSGAVYRIGRKVLIDEPKFIEWVKSNPARAA